MKTTIENHAFQLAVRERGFPVSPNLLLSQSGTLAARLPSTVALRQVSPALAELREEQQEIVRRKAEARRRAAETRRKAAERRRTAVHGD